MMSAPLGDGACAAQRGRTRRRFVIGLLGLTTLLPASVAAGKNRNHRRQRRKQRRQRKPQSWPFLYVSLFVHNQRSTPISVREWTWDDGSEYGIGFWRDQGWRALPAKPAAGPDPFFDFVRDDDEVVVELSSGHVFQASNPALGFPRMNIWVGKWSADGLDKSSTWESLLDAGFDVNERRTIAGFQVQRLPDANSHKRFQVNLV